MKRDAKMKDPLNISENLVKDLIKNQKCDRFWRNLRFLIIILFLFGVIFVVYQKTKSDSSDNAGADLDKSYVSLVRLNGEISAESDFSAKNVLPMLQAAFSDQNAKGVVLEINSGGGSPVQSSIIEAKINQLKKKYNKKVVVVGEDLLASGAYLVSMGADKIYVNADTITGSIGVIMAGFGFTDLINNIGISRRVYTAGDNKNRLDAFKPVTPEDKEKIKKILDETHDDFIQIVKTSRGDRLKGNENELFSGDFWTGTSAYQLGIVDGIGNLADVIPKEFDVEHYVDYSQEPTFFEYVMKNLQMALNLNISSYHHQMISAEI